MVDKNKLLRAVLDKNLTKVRDYIIVDGEDPYYKDEKGRSYLDLAVYLKELTIVQFFLEEGLGANVTDQDSITPLHRACRVGSLEVVKQLHLYGADLTATAKNDITPLHVAVSNAHYDVIEFLFSKFQQYKDRDKCMNPRDADGQTPFHYACNDGAFPTVELLLEYKCRFDVRNNAGNTPFHFGAVSNSVRVVKQLVDAENGKYKHLLNERNLLGQTPLHLAVLANLRENVIFLLEYGADQNVQDNDGNTCAHLALKNGYIPLIHCMLMNKSMDSSICDNDENTVLHLALRLGHVNLISGMISRASDLSKQDANGCSVIIEAIKNQLEDLAVDMLDACPSLAHTATDELVTPLHLAAERGMTTLTKKLLIAGAQVDAADASGLTPSLYCAKNDSVLECLAMIEDLMMVTDNNGLVGSEDHKEQIKGNSSKISSKISV